MFNGNGNDELNKLIGSLDLLVFGVNGVVAHRNGHRVLPEMRQFFFWLHSLATAPAVAIMTNEGGVGLGLWANEDKSVRLWLRDRNMSRLPTMQMVNDRLRDIANDIPVPVAVYVSYAWRRAYKDWAPVPYEYAGQREWAHTWRMPRPGMVQAAMSDHGVVDLKRALVVGEEIHCQAATAAGVRGMTTSQFLKLAQAAMPMEIA